MMTAANLGRGVLDLVLPCPVLRIDFAPSAYALITGCTGVLGLCVSLPKRSSTRVALAGRGQASRPVTQVEQGRGPSEPGTSGVPAMHWAANACMNHINFERIQAASKLCYRSSRLLAATALLRAPRRPACCWKRGCAVGKAERTSFVRCGRHRAAQHGCHANRRSRCHSAHHPPCNAVWRAC